MYRPPSRKRPQGNPLDAVEGNPFNGIGFILNPQAGE